ncbi:MAG TPA: hypothetical protein VGD80_20840, partial [Kofleriaceae bacterium]
MPSPPTSTVRSALRWKLACAVFAGIAGYGMVFHRSGSSAPAPAAAARTASIPFQLRRPLRVSAEAAGVSRSDLVARVLRARSLRDIRTLTEKLAAVGDDQTVDQLMPLLDDPRRGVPEAILACYGGIATQHAVAILVERAGDDRPAVRAAALT